MSQFASVPYGNKSEGGQILLNLETISYIKTTKGVKGMTELEIGYPAGPLSLSGESADFFIKAFKEWHTHTSLPAS